VEVIGGSTQLTKIGAVDKEKVGRRVSDKWSIDAHVVFLGTVRGLWFFGLAQHSSYCDTSRQIDSSRRAHAIDMDTRRKHRGDNWASPE
jgi:hypothetical protein